MRCILRYCSFIGHTERAINVSEISAFDGIESSAVCRMECRPWLQAHISRIQLAIHLFVRISHIYIYIYIYIYIHWFTFSDLAHWLVSRFMSLYAKRITDLIATWSEVEWSRVDRSGEERMGFESYVKDVTSRYHCIVIIVESCRWSIVWLIYST